MSIVLPFEKDCLKMQLMYGNLDNFELNSSEMNFQEEFKNIDNINNKNSYFESCIFKKNKSKYEKNS